MDSKVVDNNRGTKEQLPLKIKLYSLQNRWIQNCVHSPLVHCEMLKWFATLLYLMKLEGQGKKSNESLPNPIMGL